MIFKQVRLLDFLISCAVSRVEYVSAVDCFGCSPLHYAVWHGDFIAVTVLLHVDSPLIETASIAGKSLLWIAAERGHVRVFRLLLAKLVTRCSPATTAAATATRSLVDTLGSSRLDFAASDFAANDFAASDFAASDHADPDLSRAAASTSASISTSTSAIATATASNIATSTATAASAASAATYCAREADDDSVWAALPELQVVSPHLMPLWRALVNGDVCGTNASAALVPRTLVHELLVALSGARTSACPSEEAQLMAFRCLRVLVGELPATLWPSMLLTRDASGQCALDLLRSLRSHSSHAAWLYCVLRCWLQSLSLEPAETELIFSPGGLFVLPTGLTRAEIESKRDSKPELLSKSVVAGSIDVAPIVTVYFDDAYEYVDEAEGDDP